MRYTLLPNSERTLLKRIYSVRAVISLCCAVCVAGIIGAISLLPAYIHASEAEKDETQLYASLKGDSLTQGSAQIQNDLRNDGNLIGLVSAGLLSPRPSIFVDDLTSLRGDTQLTSISVNFTSTSTVSMVIQGIAPTRDSLIALKSRLEGAFSGSNINLPISELVQDTDIQFSLEIDQQLP